MVAATSADRWFVRVAALLALAAGLAASAQTTDRGERASSLIDSLRIRILSPRDHLRKTRELVSACEATVDRFLPAGNTRHTVWLTIRVAEPDTPRQAIPPLGRIVELDTAMTAQQVADTCATALLQRRLGIDPSSAAARVDWLAAAVVFDLLYARTPGGQNKPDYRPLAAAIARGAKPTLENLIERPIDPAWPYAYRLYAMSCHATARILADAITAGSGGKNALQAFAEMLASGDSAEDARRKLCQIAGLDTAADEWLLDRMTPRLAASATAAETDQLARRLRETLGIAILAPDDRGVMGFRRVPIHEMRKQFPDSELPASLLADKESRIFALLKDAPLILQKPLAEYMAAFQARKQGASWRCFLDMLEQAEQNFERGIHDYEGTRELLDQVERQYNRRELDLQPFFRIAREHAEASARLAPRTAQLLDSRTTD